MISGKSGHKFQRVFGSTFFQQNLKYVQYGTFPKAYFSWISTTNLKLFYAMHCILFPLKKKKKKVTVKFAESEAEMELLMIHDKGELIFQVPTI